MTYLHGLGVATSQLLNTLLGGDPDETICSRVGKKAIQQEAPLWAILFSRFMDLFEKDHCKLAIETDEGEPIGA